jgi:hypothetical protein
VIPSLRKECPVCRGTRDGRRGAGYYGVPIPSTARVLSRGHSYGVCAIPPTARMGYSRSFCTVFALVGFWGAVYCDFFFSTGRSFSRSWKDSLAMKLPNVGPNSEIVDS